MRKKRFLKTAAVIFCQKDKTDLKKCNRRSAARSGAAIIAPQV